MTARGTCRGRIAAAPRGSGGFGYDPIFEPASEPPGGRTLGEWSAAEKNEISHRARAARRMSGSSRRSGTDAPRLRVLRRVAPATTRRTRPLARSVGEGLARRGIGLVYGGGRVGLMGVVADAALAAGGEVIGVIPQVDGRS